MRGTAVIVCILLSTGVGFGEEGSIFFDTSDHGDPGDKAPVVKAWKSVRLDREYGGYWVVTGDVDGDGEVDVVSARNVDVNDVHYTSAAVAQRLDGSVIWQWGNPKIGRRKLHHDVACQIHDWDGDGSKEVILCTKGYIVELDGATGQERRRIRIAAGASDCVVFADLSGRKRATDVLVKTRYTQIWAYDYSGKLLWTSEMPAGSKTAHQPVPIDIDNDGTDEIMAGYAMLNSDGSVRWKFQSKKVKQEISHLDCVRVLRKGATPKDWRLVLTCCAANNVACVNGNGKVLWEVPGRHFESIKVGRIFPHLKEPQILVDIDHQPFGQSPVWVLDENGNHLAQLTTDYSRHHALLDWTGDGYDEIIVAKARGVFNRQGRRIATLDTEGPGGTVLLGDMTGDGMSDVTLTNLETLVVYIFENNAAGKVDKPLDLGCGVNFTLY
ncbi:MAG: hypothetical protein ACYSWP_09215 [Planctomycetota bacterium]|jgi:hypothetical protein